MNASRFGRGARAVLGAAALAVLAACGSGSVVSDLDAKRVITVGDGFTDVGQKGYRYSVNDGTNNWVQEFAAHYDVTVTPAAAGGWGYAQGGARVATADTTSGTAAPSIKEQIDTVLARTQLDAKQDIVVMAGGISDIVAAVNATGISDASTTAVKAAGTALAEQVKRVVDSGGKHVLVTGVYNLGHTPWARALGQEDAIEDLSTAFNDALLLGMVDVHDSVLFVDPALMYNLMYNKPENYAMDNGRDPVCTTPDATTCTTATLVPGADYNRWMFADGIYLTPEASRQFGGDSHSESAYSRFKNRF